MKKYTTNVLVIVLAVVARVVAIIRDITGKNQDISLHISRENKKLVPNADTAFIIFNLPAVFTCPYATNDCITDCYARKAEAPHFKNVLRSRTENYLMSRRPDFVELMTNEILRIAKGTKKKYIIVRIHESGDFYSRAYAQKWLQIINNCAVDKRIKFIAYTKSYPFFDGVKLPKNFSLRFSIWADTTEAAKAAQQRNKWSIYTAVPKFQVGDSFSRCRCKDCATCKHCWQNYKDIRCEIH